MVAIVVLLRLLVWFAYNLAERDGFFYPASSVTQLIGHNPKQLVRTVVEREYLELTLQDRDDPVSVMRLLGRLTRNYFQREGLQ